MKDQTRQKQKNAPVRSGREPRRKDAKPRAARKPAASEASGSGSGIKAGVAACTAVVCGALLILMSVISIVMPDRDYSSTENRKLEAFPEFSVSTLLSGKFFSGLGSWMSDQFVARDAFVSLKSSIDHAMGSRLSHGVYIGSDHYLLDTPETPDEQKLSGTVAAMNSFSAVYPELMQRIIVVPCSAAINPSFLPSNAPVRDQLADLTRFSQQLPANVQWVDPAPSLKQASNSQLYYRTDHHWTSLGAKTVFEGCYAWLGIEAPVTAYDHHQLSYTFLGTLASKSGHTGTKDPIDIYVPVTDVKYYVSIPDTGYSSSSLYVADKLNEKDQYQVFLGGNHPLVEIRTSAENGRSLLLFKDSYANSFVQFLIPYFDRIVMIDPRYYYDNLSSVISSGKITDVLYLYSANTLFADSSLADCLNSVSAASDVPMVPKAVADADAAPDDAGGEITYEDNDTYDGGDDTYDGDGDTYDDEGDTYDGGGEGTDEDLWEENSDDWTDE